MAAKTIREFRGRHSWLSNYAPAKVTYQSITYPTVEHAFQAAKTLDVWERKKIAAEPTAGQAKRHGRSLTLRPDWEGAKVGIMLKLLRKKFAPGGMLAVNLEETGDAVLEEGNRWGDTFWGVCLGAPPSATRGHNMLGKLIMQVRWENRMRAKTREDK